VRKQILIKDSIWAAQILHANPSRPRESKEIKPIKIEAENILN